MSQGVAYNLRTEMDKNRDFTIQNSPQNHEVITQAFITYLITVQGKS